MKNFVIDASVAAKWFFRERGSGQAEILIDELIHFFAPEYFLIELDSIISKKVRRGEISIKKAQLINKKIRKLPFSLLSYKQIGKLSFDLSTSLPITLYDAMYLAVSVEKDGVLYTADRRFVNSLSNTIFGGYTKSLWHLN